MSKNMLDTLLGRIPPRRQDGTLRGPQSSGGMKYRKGPHEWPGIPEWCWPAIARQLPRRRRAPFRKKDRKGGRPPCDDRLAMSAIFWRLRSNGTWSRLPERFGSASTARRKLALWSVGGRLEYAWRAYLWHISEADIRRWGEDMASGKPRPHYRWRFGLDYIWKTEFAEKAATNAYVAGLKRFGGEPA